jgi:hypothetical protein
MEGDLEMDRQQASGRVMWAILAALLIGCAALEP